jgi:inorganic triphosphatase YgiF
VRECDSEGMSRRAPRRVEVEWQFAVHDVDAFARWLVQARLPPPWTMAPGEVVHLRDAYFDTAEWQLARAGYALRLRRSGARVEATLKALRGAHAGRAARREISERLSDARVGTLRRARGAVATRLRRVVGSHALVRLFAVRTRRRTLRVCRRGRPVAELALDRTRIVPPRGRARRLERLEVEVKAGAPALVARFVATLRRHRHLTVTRRSKFEEGIAAARLAPPARR